MVKAVKNRLKKKNFISYLRTLLSAALCILAAVGVILSPCKTAQASGSDVMPELDSQAASSLSVKMCYTDPNVEDSASEAERIKTMQGVTVKIVQVASLTVQGGSAQYTLLDSYSSSGINFAGMTVTQQAEAAKTLLGMADVSSAFTAVSDENGLASFANLSRGIYLVFQDDDANAAYQVEAIAPMLIAVPYPDTESSVGNSWLYDVTISPKTELDGPKKNGSVTVTKQLFNTKNGYIYSPPDGVTLEFHVGLFTDADCTVRAEGTTDQTLTFANSSTATVVFENLKTDQTYYIAETDGNGNVTSVIFVDDIDFGAFYNDGQSVKLTSSVKDAAISFKNGTPVLPDSYYYSGTLTITKKTQTTSGEAYPMNRTFYARAFADADYTTAVSSVITLNLDGDSSVSVPVNVDIGTEEDSEMTFYVTETDKDGNPLSSDGSAGFTFQLTGGDGKVVLTPESPSAEVVITNVFEKTSEDDPTVTPAETPTVTPTGTPVVTMPEAYGPGHDSGGENNASEHDGTGTSTQPRTGDDTPVIPLLALLAGSAVLTVLSLKRLYRNRRE